MIGHTHVQILCCRTDIVEAEDFSSGPVAGAAQVLAGQGVPLATLGSPILQQRERE
jgi:hypothetical protein